jgi:hypothetical protein
MGDIAMPKVREMAYLLSLVLLVAAYCSWMPQRLTAMPASYGPEAGFLLEGRYRPNLTASWEPTRLRGRRINLTLAAHGNVSLVQGTLRWNDEAGFPVFETKGIYGVDRRSRANLSAYGDVSRTGQYFFPPHTQPRSYPVWNPMYTGPYRADFERHAQIEGLPVLVFRFQVRALDESPGYANMPGVPERHRALTDSAGLMWIEPVSGILVHYTEQGKSYLAGAADGVVAGEFFHWNVSFDPPTRVERLKLARSARREIFWYERGVPALILGTGIAALVAFRWRGCFTRRDAGAAP